MRRLLLLSAVSMLIIVMLAPAAMGQSRGPSGANGTYNCPDFDFQEDAQAVLDSNPSDPNGLDRNKDGVACETLPRRGAEQPTQQPPPPQQPQMMEQTTMMESTTTTEKPLPQTGGASVLLPAGAVLAGSGLLALTILRRR